ncbi:MAG TPA: SGNH/GDSL hydrolase family protein [Verrucomicrobiae bacterium]|jgi:hypothetical protein
MQTILRLTLAVATAITLLTFNPNAVAQTYETKPANPFFANFEPLRAPLTDGLYLQPGDRLAIIGDSITEQKMYSRIIETYLTVCVPQLKITTRQLGWSGETAMGFLQRMTNDCLWFQPTIATLCYGMNDFHYRPYTAADGNWYSNNYNAVVCSLTNSGARVILGSAGDVGKTPHWAQNTNLPTEVLNLSLCHFRNIDIGLAAQDKTRFADVFWPMLVAGFDARQKYGSNYALNGHDGVHPGWAGHLIMAYAFLKAMGLDGNIGTFTVDLGARQALVSDGHTLDSFTNNTLTITSSRYPFCATGAVDNDTSIRSGMSLVPFNQDLNRLTLVVKNGAAKKYGVTWGTETRTYTAQQLATGVNLAADFNVNPFSAAFSKVDAAVTAKQNYETHQIKELFHSSAAKTNLDEVAAASEKERQPLVDAIAQAFKPVTYTLHIEAK